MSAVTCTLCSHLASEAGRLESDYVRLELMTRIARIDKVIAKVQQVLHKRSHVAHGKNGDALFRDR